MRAICFGASFDARRTHLTREKTSRFSSTCTCIPIIAAAHAARSPTGPAPLITTLTPMHLPSSVFCRSHVWPIFLTSSLVR